MDPGLMHNSHEKNYRSPFGAVCCHTGLVLSLEVNCQARPDSVKLIAMNEEMRKTAFDMYLTAFAANQYVYKIEITAPETPGIISYYFTVNLEGSIYYCGSKTEYGGPGTTSLSIPLPWKITVYQSFSIPEWFKSGVIYQIYVDRFFNPYPHILRPRRGAMLHADWNDRPYYIRDEKSRIVAYDFFGGNLAGVIAKLPFLKELGVTIIYLNPIFDAVSNHKYDTGDYYTIDPMYGDNQTFSELCEKAEQIGIHVILDGVFSHTGSDSIYFNKYGHYASNGAYQDQNSPYYHWYNFIEYPDKYQCWWGIDTLPEVKELDEGYLNFLFNRDDGVVSKWMNCGVKGWRLDVADELPDEFIEKFKSVIRQITPDSILIGEVWENAARKISYGQQRRFLQGRELDAVTNYPLRSIMIDFMLGLITAGQVSEKLMDLYETYPEEHFYSTVNLLSSHDVPRILSILGECPPDGQLSSAERRDFRLSAHDRQKAIKRLKLLVLWQMTFPGVPCIYYGDEAGAEGLGDPYNRGTYPWGGEAEELLAWYRRLIAVRKRYPMLIKGDWQAQEVSRDVFVFSRSLCGRYALICINRTENVQQVRVALPNNGRMYDILNGESTQAKGGFLDVGLGPLTGRIFINQIQHPDLIRASGILLHVTSLPGTPCGNMGPIAYKWIDFLVESAQSLWQVLPLNPPDDAGSPYASCSAFAGNYLLISIQELIEDGLLAENDSRGSENQRDVKLNQLRILKIAYENFLRRGLNRSEGFLRFKKDNQYWLKDYGKFVALKELSGGKPWYEWQGEVNHTRMKEIAAFQEFVQYVFSCQWQRIRKYANSRGIAIIGDVPLYVHGDSADVWAHSQYFKLDFDGSPLFLSGAPPDQYNVQGQVWGHPVYAWEAFRRDGYLWWRERIRHLLTMFDYLRLDHFRGFAAFWEIPAFCGASCGHWASGPGKEFFNFLTDDIGILPVIVEDLGYITQDVIGLREALGYPGMTIRLFGLSEKIHNVYYSSTHDTDTLVGWTKSIKKAEKIINEMFHSPAAWTIFPLQDILGFGNSARMNCPGEVNAQNWRWQITSLPGQDTAQWLRSLTLAAGRTAQGVVRRLP